MSVNANPNVRQNPSLQRYYSSLESRIGYRFFLGGTRHFGFYSPGTKWPFPINDALRRMEDHLFDSLQLQPGSKVLDAGCGVGHVAMHLARKGLQIQGIDFMPSHVKWARQNIQTNGLDERVAVRWMDYHDLDGLQDTSFDGVYTMETFVHATDPSKALGEFFRVLRPGGRIALYEYDHPDFGDIAVKDRPKGLESLKAAADQINQNASMPSNTAFKQGVLQAMLEEQGFEDVVVTDLSDNIKPMLRLFFLVAYVPYLVICLLGFQAWFMNTQAAVEGYRILDKGLWRYVVVTARKPLEKVLIDSGLRERKSG